MDMIAMLAGFSTPLESSKQNTGTTGGGSTTSNAASTTAGYGTVDEYLRSRNLLNDLPALPKPSKPKSDPPYNPDQTKADYLASIGFSSGKIPTAAEFIADAEAKARSYVEEQKNPAIKKSRIQELLKQLMLGNPVGNVMNQWAVQMANRAIIGMAKEQDWWKRELSRLADVQASVFGNRPNFELSDIAKRVYAGLSSESDAVLFLRSLAAGFQAPDAISYPNLAGFVDDNARWYEITTLIKAKDNAGENGTGAAIIASAFKIADLARPNEGASSFYSGKTGVAIAEGLILKKYKDIASQASKWVEARNRYQPVMRRYIMGLTAWQVREAYRSNRTKAIEEYYTAVANKLKSDAEKKEYRDRRDALRRGAAAAEAEKTAARLKKEAEDALAAKATAEQTARDLQTALDNLSNAGSTADVAALNATIERLKQELVNAQNAAAEAARRANETTTTSGGDTTGAAGVATDAATDATQTAADALQQAGEEVTFKPKEKKGGGVMLLVVGAIAVGGYMWMKRRQLRQIGP